jgi:MFS family permease
MMTFSMGGRKKVRKDGEAGRGRKTRFCEVVVWSLSGSRIYSTTSMTSTPASGGVGRLPLATLFFFTALPMGMWNVPLANVFAAHGRGHLVPWVLATTAVAAFISPLFVGALADQRIAPTLLLRWLSVATSAGLALLCTVLGRGFGDGIILICAQLLALVSTPMWSVATSIVLSQIHDPKSQFGPLRAFATLGWMVGCWVVSFILQADASLTAGWTAAGLWLGVTALSWTLPAIPPVDSGVRRNWRQVLGLDALQLLRHRDHRVVFLTAALYSVPLAAFYPYTARQLHDLNVSGIAAVISLAQTTEVLTMLLLAGVLARFRLKWIFLSGIAICAFRYAMNALHTPAWAMIGTTLHGFAFTLYFITTQIYLEERIDPKWRTRAQALLVLLMSGFGNLAGYLGGGWWHQACQINGKTDWTRFWLGETAVTAAVCLFFLLAYRGRGSKT